MCTYLESPEDILCKYMMGCESLAPSVSGVLRMLSCGMPLVTEKVTSLFVWLSETVIELRCPFPPRGARRTGKQTQGV